MPKQKKPIPGEQDDGSFDLSDVTGDATDPPGAPAEGDDASVAERSDLMMQLAEAVEARKRSMADLVNYRRRAEENEIRARQEGARSVLRSLLPVLEHVDLALAQDESEMTSEQLFTGVRILRDEIVKALETHGVRLIHPEAGAEFDPNEHRAVMRECTDEQPPNTIVSVMQVGYATAEAILRPASVSVAAPTETEEED